MPIPFDVKLMNLACSLLFLLLFVMVLGAAFWWSLSHPFFSLTGITVQGDVAHNNAVTLRANVAPRLAGNFFTIDLRRTRSAFEAVPWVRRAIVQRDFPNRLKVTLAEHQVAAVWGSEADARLVNVQGEVFEVNPGDVETDDLPRLIGPEGQSAQVLQMYQVLKPELARLDTILEELELSGRGSWEAHLDNGAVIELGRGTTAEMRERVGRFVSTLAQVAARYGRRNGQDLESADLRHADGYALKLRGITTVSSTTDRK